MNYEFKDRGATLYFPGVRWGSYNELKVHARAADLIAVKIPAHSAYISRGTGTLYCRAVFMVLRVTGFGLTSDLQRGVEVLRIPLTKSKEDS